MRAFIFDDDADFRSILALVLERRGYEVITFPRPALCQRCRCAPGHKCADIIISDLTMPRLNGVDFVEHQKMQGCAAENVALISGEWSKQDLERARELGCKVFHKPFEMDELKEWLADCEKRMDPNRVLESWFQQESSRHQRERDNTLRLDSQTGSFFKNRN